MGLGLHFQESLGGLSLIYPYFLEFSEYEKAIPYQNKFYFGPTEAES